MNMTALEVLSQRFMLSPCGKYALWVSLDELSTKAPGWTDCTDISDAELSVLMRDRWLAQWRA